MPKGKCVCLFDLLGERNSFSGFFIRHLAIHTAALKYCIGAGAISVGRHLVPIHFLYSFKEAIPSGSQ